MGKSWSHRGQSREKEAELGQAYQEQLSEAAEGRAGRGSCMGGRRQMWEERAKVHGGGRLCHHQARPGGLSDSRGVVWAEVASFQSSFNRQPAVGGTSASTRKDPHSPGAQPWRGAGSKQGAPSRGPRERFNQVVARISNSFLLLGGLPGKSPAIG